MVLSWYRGVGVDRLFGGEPGMNQGRYKISKETRPIKRGGEHLQHFPVA